MDFLTITFGIFFLISAGGYYVIPKKFQWIWLLGSSLIFYMWSVPQMVWYLGAGALISWAYGRFAPKHNKGILVLTIGLQAGMLLFVKFYPWVQIRFSMPALAILVPVGISFFTLQNIGYCIDIYKEKSLPESNFFRYFLFVSFFPQIIQGPIPRYEKLAPQLFEKHTFQEEKIRSGLQLMLWGFFLKLVIADRAAILVNQIFPEYWFYEGTMIAVAAVFYSIQLYTDFLGCVCIAMGAAECYGITLETNFQRPYLSVSVKDFWRRWHISLSSWLRDYIYIPLGGNRKGIFRKYVNMILTFSVSGIWHGVGLKYLCWGILQAVYQITGEVLMPIRRAGKRILRIQEDSKVYKTFCQICTFCLITAGWVIFRANGVMAGLDMLWRILTDITPWIFWDGTLYTCGISLSSMAAWGGCVLLVWRIEKLQEKQPVRELLNRQHIIVRWLTALGAIALILVLGVYGPGYEATQFLYGQF